MTVAQYLFRNRRYGGGRQQPIVGEPCYDGHQAVVIDESSMLTEDDLVAVLATFTPAVKRLILVGDPAQLPPIGPGRPFADLVAHLDPLVVADDEDLDDLARRRGAIDSRWRYAQLPALGRPPCDSSTSCRTVPSPRPVPTTVATLGGGQPPCPC